jgi:hypothetical protein
VKSRRPRWGRNVSRSNAHRILTGKGLGKRPLVRISRRWEIKMNFRGRGREKPQDRCPVAEFAISCAKPSASATTVLNWLSPLL